jgi:hypothetical protein
VAALSLDSPLAVLLYPVVKSLYHQLYYSCCLFVRVSSVSPSFSLHTSRRMSFRCRKVICEDQAL